jgi:hypothetical protein
LNGKKEKYANKARVGRRSARRGKEKKRRTARREGRREDLGGTLEGE